ncbi:MAG TPA: hypothetical protein VJU87_07790 [Gemmatimonadaceae bacterium]|nr:hypothetical protein [Gemmatimonadaceae bacterium]
MNFRIAAAAALVCSAAASATAQVGYPPARSPYIDLERTQELSIIAGRYYAPADPAGVAPGSGLITGVHYEWRAGGPAYLIGEIARTSSTRTVLDPAKSGAARNLGERDWPLYLADAGVALGLTGGKSWHRLVPQVKGGLGFASDMHGGADVGGFKFGTRFAFNWGAAVRYAPGGRLGLRLDWTNRLYSIGYPNAYFQPTASGGTPILVGKDNSAWRNNMALTLGVSYLFSR